MSEEVVNKEVQDVEQEKIDRVKESINRMENKESKFMFCVPDVDNPTAAVYEIYFHATTVKNMGYKVVMLTEKEGQEAPKWIEKELTEIDHIPMAKNDLKVSPDDVMVLPEVFSNIMEQTKNLPCLRVGLLQSIDYKLNALVPGTNWKSFGIDNIITTSETLKDFVDSYYGKKTFKIKHYNIGLPDYFKRTAEPQKPIISVIGRNANEISKLVKLFYTRYPQYRWVTFDPMRTNSKPSKSMRRKDFADRLRGNFAAIWVDRISSWGTFPLECMASGTIPICLKPDITPEYILERGDDGEATKIVEGAGVWTDNFYDLPVLLGEVLLKYLDDSIDDSLYDSMEKVAGKYTQAKSTEQLISLYNELLSERLDLFKGAITPPEEVKK